jgi:hypothetical protein
MVPKIEMRVLRAVSFLRVGTVNSSYFDLVACISHQEPGFVEDSKQLLKDLRNVKPPHPPDLDGRPVWLSD